MVMQAIVSILNVGIIGFGFLLAWLAYGLLDKHQARKGKADPRPIYVFMSFSLCLVALGMASEYWNRKFDFDYKASDIGYSTQIVALNEKITACNSDKAEIAKGIRIVQQKLKDIHATVSGARDQAFGASGNTSCHRGQCSDCSSGAVSAMHTADAALDQLTHARESLSSFLSAAGIQ